MRIKEDVVFVVNNGKFIVLEGVDGSGITTQTSLLKKWFTANKNIYGKAYFTKEPTDGPVGSVIRQALAKRLKPLDERVMALLFAADRLDHLYCPNEAEQQGGLSHLLAQGVNVVSDRYYLSSYAYQSLRVDLDWLQQINKHALKPDLTIFLQIPVNASVQRRNDSRFHEELYEKTETLINIRNNYLAIAKKLQAEGENITIIDGTRDIETVFSDIKKAVMELF